MTRPIMNGNRANRFSLRQQLIQAHKDQRGLSLMELLIVLAIIGLLAALVGPTLYARLKPAKQTAVRTQITNFSSALDSFLIDMGRYPTTEEGLSALRENPGNDKWKGPYLRKQIPLDPWGNAYIYRAPGRSGGYEIQSLGADNNEGGEDENADINSWES